METIYNMSISYFQLISISSPGSLVKTTYSLYENNLTLFSFCFSLIDIAYTISIYIISAYTISA